MWQVSGPYHFSIKNKVGGGDLIPLPWANTMSKCFEYNKVQFLRREVSISFSLKTCIYWTLFLVLHIRNYKKRYFIHEVYCCDLFQSSQDLMCRRLLKPMFAIRSSLIHFVCIGVAHPLLITPNAFCLRRDQSWRGNSNACVYGIWIELALIYNSVRWQHLIQYT